MTHRKTTPSFRDRQEGAGGGRSQLLRSIGIYGQFIVVADKVRIEAHIMDQGFFHVRIDRLTPREKDYVRAMAELPHGNLIAARRRAPG